jgi:hypothetical protein
MPPFRPVLGSNWNRLDQLTRFWRLTPESAATSLQAVKEALMRHMPDSEAGAMTPAELFQAAQIPAQSTGTKALKQLLAAGQVRRIGNGVTTNPFRYFAERTSPKGVPVARASHRLQGGREIDL